MWGPLPQILGMPLKSRITVCKSVFWIAYIFRVKLFISTLHNFKAPPPFQIQTAFLHLCFHLVSCSDRSESISNANPGSTQPKELSLSPLELGGP